MNRNVLVLLLSGALGLCIAPMVVFIGGLVGASLAPDPELSTLPVAGIVIGTACAVIPVSRLMQRFGRKKIFLAASLYSALVSCFAAISISYESFWLFCLSTVLLGGALAVIQQYRFAAMESVEPYLAPKAASFVLLGGLIAAILGPELAHLGRALHEVPFSGSFTLLSILCLLSGVVMLFFQPVVVTGGEEELGGRPLIDIMHSSLFWVAVMSATIGYAVMSYVMTATPVSMHVMEGHSLEDTKWVIQSHILAMFLPSLVSGYLISKFGEYRLMLAGLAAYTVCLMIALSGQNVMHYWLGLVLLGIGWNFLFVAGTVLLPKVYQPAERYKVQGFNDFFVFVFQAAASISSGVVIYSVGWNSLLIYAIPLILVQMLVIFIWRIGKSKEGELV
ncbi:MULTISPECIES: MFS transporter [unclassified Oleiphilus]|jgi:MFS family permease|uniref:MFS transporter n=5 Tax=Oleiphilus TaxID=141450 RepID=UPI0007C299E4|nr:MULTISPECIES: MFS transporter [unclassified Oleiphilus]KZY44116.1 ABC transporter permease [Oleiphilus sp. HI0050]KZY73284.1 ABC transporter permease [Oleiphilus sp. HI0068]KZY76991.1 ABC transporter permease [Oleiphilus sp. HI0069]KZY89667.1 ABC transporter permease [Oleiphilus sp. HI0072]KZZ17680.1 ABC transporter permease [Oleiphilus sp. HI0078]